MWHPDSVDHGLTPLTTSACPSVGFTPTYQPAVTVTPPPPPDPASALWEIAAQLRRIADALEAGK
jgi:hypothetical protein